MLAARVTHRSHLRLPDIEHNPNEKRPGYGIYWLLAAILTFGWAGTWYFFGFDWHQIALGSFTSMVLTIWAIEITGNKVPDSWVRKPPRSRRS